MKTMNKNKITILMLVVVGMMIFSFNVKAADPSLYVSPATADKDMGSAFDVVVKVNPTGEKVCAVEGQLSLSKLVVQKIDVAEGIMPQTSPSFSNNLYFLLGIPGCTTQEKTLFTVRVKADTVGKASAGFKNVDIIGEGMSISSAFVDGNYEITVPSVSAVPPAVPTIPSTPSTPQQISCVCDDWNSWQNGNCGEGNCALTQRLQERDRACTPSGCDIEKQIQCVNDSTCITSAKEKVEIPETVPQASLLAAIGSAMTLGTGNAWLGIIVGIGVILLSIFVILWVSNSYKRYREKKKE